VHLSFGWRVLLRRAQNVEQQQALVLLRSRSAGGRMPPINAVKSRCRARRACLSPIIIVWMNPNVRCDLAASA
jgi:hypothetical protein